MYPVSGLERESKSLPPTPTRRLYAEDAGEAVRLCEALLDEPELDPAVRIGDAYGFVVEHHCQQGNFQVVNAVFTFLEIKKKKVTKWELRVEESCNVCVCLSLCRPTVN